MTITSAPTRYEKAYAETLAEVTTVPAERCIVPGVCGTWSLKDLLGHLQYWDEMQARELETIARGQTWIAEPLHFDVVNAREVEARSSLSWDAILATAAETYSRLSPLVRDPGEDLAEFRIHEHWEEHLAQIREWKELRDV